MISIILPDKKNNPIVKPDKNSKIIWVINRVIAIALEYFLNDNNPPMTSQETVTITIDTNAICGRATCV